MGPPFGQVLLIYNVSTATVQLLKSLRIGGKFGIQLNRFWLGGLIRDIVVHTHVLEEIFLIICENKVFE